MIPSICVTTDNQWAVVLDSRQGEGAALDRLGVFRGVSTVTNGPIHQGLCMMVVLRPCQGPHSGKLIAHGHRPQS